MNYFSHKKTARYCAVAVVNIVLLLIAGCDNPATLYLPASQSDSAGITIIGNAEHAEDSTSWWIDSMPSVVIGDEIVQQVPGGSLAEDCGAATSAQSGSIDR